MQSLLDEISGLVTNPRDGLPEALFLFISRHTPLINVDLLIQNPQGQTLLTWRHDKFYGPGWHIPGGIIRFKETVSARAQKVARLELNATIELDAQPLTFLEIMSPQRDTRGHFISLLYRCRLTSDLNPSQQAGSAPAPGEWRWHTECPTDLIPQHHAYRTFIQASPPTD
jgi:ADP-ribose pyrophosphatase YjhB (NUDIX family)